MSEYLKIQNLTFSIGSFKMENLSFSVEKGEYFILTGANGSGKSLLIKLICGLLQPTYGTICVGDKNITNLPPWQRNLGYVPQDKLLFPNRNVRDNIAFGLEVKGIPKTERIKIVDDTAKLFKIEDLLDRKIPGLSGGESQKVCLTRAIVLKPDLLILDEPVNAIDEDHREEICNYLKNIHSNLGVTVIHISHNSQETEQLAEKVCIMEQGKITSVRQQEKQEYLK